MKSLIKYIIVGIFFTAATISANAITVEVKGTGGIVYGNGTTQVCPNQSTETCAMLTVDLNGTVVKIEVAEKNAVVHVIETGETIVSGIVSYETVDIDLDNKVITVKNLIVE